MKKISGRNLAVLLLAVAVAIPLVAAAAPPQPVTLLNVSYDISRELFAEVNPAFIRSWKARTGQTLVIRQSHGGSSSQARAVSEGLQADVVTFNQYTDIELLRKAGLVAQGWQEHFPNGASPYYSLPVFLVRRGNPKQIADWSDLVRPGVQVIFANPKTSGNGRYTYLAAYAFALNKYGHDETKARQFVAGLLANAPVLDSGGRAATTTFVERRIGDVLITFESEVNSIQHEYATSALERVVPSMSLRADFPVAVVDKVADRRGTREVAHAYLEFLYSEAGQEILARNFYRVYAPSMVAKYKPRFPELRLLSVQEVFGGWDNVTRKHFSDGGILDQAMAAKR